MVLPLGTLFNVITIVIGSLIGMLFGDRFPERIKQIVFQGMGLVTFALGVQMGLKMDNVLIFIFSILLGAIMGEGIDVDKQLSKLSDFLKASVKSENTKFTEGLITMFVIACVGPFTILGTINEGLRGDHTLLFTKAVLDGFVSIAFASAFGSGILFSTIPLFVFQIALTLSAGLVKDYFTPHVINELTAVGGVLIMGIGVNLLEVKKIKIANLLPALLITVLLSLFFK